MTKPISRGENGTWMLGSMQFDAEVNVCRILFRHDGGGYNDAYNVTVFADGKPIGVGALSEHKGENLACFAVDPIIGAHEITLKTPRSAILDVTFDAEPLFVPEPEITIPEPIDIGAPYWEATDMLGRKIVSAEDTHGEHQRQVGIFYWTWRDEHAHLRTMSVSKILEQYPAAEYNKNHPAWGKPPYHVHWNEPLFGYYRNDDPYVIRRHASMLAAAGVDFLLFDCTNGSILWRDAFEALLKGLREAMLDGIKVPKIAFMLNFGPLETTEWMLRALYQELYRPGRYRELWYCLDGKPMIMAYPEALPEKGVCDADTAVLNEIRSFFTFRHGQPLYEGGAMPAFMPAWGWLENAPQNRYGEREDGSFEMMTVGVAQNSSKHRLCTYFNDRETFGRSYTAQHGHSLLTKTSYLYGYNFAEQWERAIALDPDIVFVTGWNEWIMGQYKEPWVTDPDSTQLAMVDQFDREHSRDIEPDKDGYLDTYYLQLCHNIRRFKGSRPRPMASEPITVDMKGDFSEWEAVKPTFRADRGTTIHRDWNGFGDTHYVNDSGRNNIVEAKVARNQEKLWFYVKTAEALSEPSEQGWMTLLLQTGDASNWEGFDYMINRTAPKNGKTEILRHKKGEGFAWEKIGDAEITVKKDKLVIAVDRETLGLSKEGKPLDFCFKWCDNNLLGEEPALIDLYVNGNTAPLGRFSFRYREKTPYAFPPRP